MPWVRLDDAILDHPKITRLSPLGWAQHTAAVVWSTRNLTDGIIPYRVVERLLDWNGIAICLDLPADAGEAIVAASRATGWRSVNVELVPGGLWHDDSSAGSCPSERCQQAPRPGDDELLIHDFLEYQPPRAAVLAERIEKREAKVRAGQMGAAARWGSREAVPTHGKSNGKAHGRPHGTPIAGASQTDGPVPVPVPVPKPEALTTDVVEVVPKDQEIALTGPRSAEAQALTARDITAAYVDAFRETHDGADPIDPKGMAGLVKKALTARTPPEAVMRAAVECGRSGAGARGFQRVLFEKPRGRPEPKGFQGIRDYVESLKEGP